MIRVLVLLLCLCAGAFLGALEMYRDAEDDTNDKSHTEGH